MNPFALRLLGSAASTVDRAFVAAMQMRNRRVRARAEALSHAERIDVARARSSRPTARPELFDESRRLLPAAVPPCPRRCAACASCPGAASASSCRGRARSSPSTPRSASATSRTCRTARRTRASTARGGAAPAVIAIHGYMGGHWAIEERAWPIRSLNRWGLDVAVAVLPFHGVRARPAGSAPPFPGGDPRVTNEGFRQVVTDLRSLAGILRERGATQRGRHGHEPGRLLDRALGHPRARPRVRRPPHPARLRRRLRARPGAAGDGRVRRRSSTPRSKRPTASSARSRGPACVPRRARAHRRRRRPIA